MPKPPDMRDKVEILKFEKRGEYYQITGVDKSTGRKVSVEAPAPTIEERSRKDAEALVRRSIYGHAQAGNHDQG